MNKMKYIILVIAIFNLTILSAQDLIILHTNDMHSSIEPSQTGSLEGNGGFQRVANYVDYMREEYKNVIVLDAGDFNQGTPYYNIFKGDLEVKLLNAIDYDAICLGNHEFDSGQEDLARRLKDLEMPIICANYDFSNTPLNGLVEPYTIIEKGGYKIGVIGSLINLKGYVMAEASEGLVYFDEIETVDKYAKILKEEKDCDLVIALNHIGYKGRKGVPSDMLMAEKTKYVDIIIGGHSHTYMKEENLVENLDGKKVVVVQAGSKAMDVGRFDIYFK